MSVGDVLEFGSVNLLNRGLGDPATDADLRDRYDTQTRVLLDVDAHVWAVQEIVGVTMEDAARTLVELAHACGMTCYLRAPSPGVPAAEQVALARADSWAGPDGERFHVGLMWKPDLQVVPGTWNAYGRDRARLWHSLASVALDVGGPKIRFCSWHADVFDPQWRVSEAIQVAWIANNSTYPVLLGCDSNSLAASTIKLPWSRRWRRPWQTRAFYDPDVYRTAAWYPYRIHQIHPEARSPRGDRRADHVLVSPQHGRLIDAAVAAGSPYTPTAGHFEFDPHPPRRPDRIYGSRHFAGHFARLDTIDTAEALRASDHLPVVSAITLADMPSTP